jgi:uncharacterized protein
VQPEPESRLDVLDVLRGVALVGMFLVHFSNAAAEGGPLDGWYQAAVGLFFEERFWAMFAILFGAGFAIQFRRAEARGERYLPKYLRRMAALAGFGFIAHGVLGFNVLLGYAIWGLALPLFRHWSTSMLVVALLISAASGNLYAISRTAYGVSVKGANVFQAEQRDAAERTRAFVEANNAAQDAEDFSTVLSARLERMPWFYAQWYSFLPVNTLTLFLLGLLGVRLGLFDRPGAHRPLIVGLTVFGAAAWAFEHWAPVDMARAQSVVTSEIIIARLAGGFGWVRGLWLTFTYMGIILLLVAANPAWLTRLAWFGWAGRTALTSYMLQIILLDVLFSNYALGVSVRPLAGAALAVALFLANVAFSRWWLARHPYGPLEWLWRSATYARWQPWTFTRVRPGVAGYPSPR